MLLESFMEDIEKFAWTTYRKLGQLKPPHREECLVKPLSMNRRNVVLVWNDDYDSWTLGGQCVETSDDDLWTFIPELDDFVDESDE